jgi:hypothetical protein
VIGESPHSVRLSRKSSKAWLLAGFLVVVGAIDLSSRAALADKRSALLTVSVRVVESCRVETSDGANTVDLKLRCSSTARPSVSMADNAFKIAPVGTVSFPNRRAVTSVSGSTLTIEF